MGSLGVLANRRGRWLAIPIVIVAALLLSACWPQPSANGGHTRYNGIERELTAANVHTLQEAWTAEVWGWLSEPIVRKGKVYLTYTDFGRTGVRAIDVGTGDTVWDERLLDGVPVMGNPALVAGTPVSFVGNSLWSGHRGRSHADALEQVCDYGTDLLDPATGEHTPVDDTGFPVSHVSSGSTEARFMLRPTGERCASPWTLTLEVVDGPRDGTASHWTATFDSGFNVLVVGDNHVFTSRNAGAVPGIGPQFEVAAYESRGCGAASCSPAWTWKGIAQELVAVAGGPLLALSAGYLVALDQATGTPLWAGYVGDSVQGMAVAHGYAYVLSNKTAGEGASVQAFSMWGCSLTIICLPAWSAPLASQTRTAPVVAGDVLYTVDDQGTVAAFDANGCWASTCDPLVTVPLGLEGRPDTELSVAQGHVFISVDGVLDAVTGRLIALAPDG